MKDELTINQNYVLRKGLDDQYSLYNNSIQKRYELSYKLFFILNLFRHSSLSLGYVKEKFENMGINMDDFLVFLRNPEFIDLLVPTKESFCIPDFYKDKKNLSPLTEISPGRIDFVITKHCNLACKHCFEGASPKFGIREYGIDVFSRIFSEFDRINLKTLKITGGEPFTVPNFDQILLELSKRHFETIVLTNGMLIKDRDIEILRLGDIHLGISLDGLDSETHDFTRGKGAFDVISRQLLRLRDAGVKFGITCSINKRNFYQIRDMISFTLDFLRAEVLFLNCLRPVGRAGDNKNLFLSEDESQEVYRVYNEAHKKYGRRLELSDDLSLVEKEKSDIIACSAGNSILAMDENLDIYPCFYAFDHEEYVIGNLLHESIDDIWRSSKLDRFRGITRLDDLDDCPKCQFKKQCALKNCRLKPVFEGKKFTSSVSYCKRNALEI